MIYALSEDYYVRKLITDDLDGPYTFWFDDQIVCQFNSHGKFFKSKLHYKNFIDNLDDEKNIVWAICHKQDGHIGNIGLHQISSINRTAEFAIVIGNREHWGKKVGFLAGKSLLFHAFFKLNLERVYCGTASENHGMKRLALSLGMKHEGTRRSHFFLDNSRVDMEEFGILKAEFSY
jgi:RimJ/RimL family protein N-acetyltransferase